MSGLVILYIILVLAMLAGIVGAVIPGLPGTSLIAGSILIWALFSGFDGVGWALAIAIIVMLLSGAIDLLASYVGAKRVGASSWGQIGAVIGFFVGLFGLLPALPIGGPLLGIFIGPLLGAFVGEFLYRAHLELDARVKQAVKAGLGVVVSTFLGNLIQGVLAVGTVIFFLWTTLPEVTG